MGNIDKRVPVRALMLMAAFAASAFAQTTQPLHLEKSIELPGVHGRIDHMSVDVKGGRLFVSALGSNTVEVVDIKAGKVVKTIGELHEPQGVLYVSEANRLFVANGGDGSVRVFDATSYAPVKTLDYGDDADNLRFDPSHKRVFVGYGSGALGEIDLAGAKTGEIRLDAHPESFQLGEDGKRIYVNLPDSEKIALVDPDKKSVVGTWKTDGATANFPMALDEGDHRLFVVTRHPPQLLIYDTNTGQIIQALPAVGDCDDVFYDGARKRIYASGGEGAISVFQQESPVRYSEIARVKTVKGARTSFFSRELDRFFLAVRSQGSQPAAIQVFMLE